MIVNKIKKYIKNNRDRRNRKIQKKRVLSWFNVKGDLTHRLNYELNENSVVFDLGGYKGEFSKKIYDKFHCKILIFEPVKSYYDKIEKLFKDNKNVKCFNFGLSGKDEVLKINLCEDASSVFKKFDTKNTEIIKLKSILNFINENKIRKVDLIKINIEGGEYELIESLLENKIISIFNNIQVQFHDFIIKNAKKRMKNIQKKLAETHQTTFQYEFVWENWELINYEKKIFDKWQESGCSIPPPHLIKQMTISEYHQKYKYLILIETGTYMGDMVEAQKTKFKKIISIELGVDLFHKATKRFKNDKNVKIVQGDSGKVLPKILLEINEPVIFWLDGHYSAGITAKGDKECPIFEELDAIFKNNELHHIILIDDAREFIGKGDYPTIEELTEYVKSKNKNYNVEVKHDIIRYVV